MRDKSEALPLELGEMMRQSYAYVIQNTGKIIALITAVVATLVTFTDVSFSELTSVGFTSSLAIMLMASYLMYFSLEDAGEKYGESCPEYEAAIARYLEARGKISPSSMSALRKFCYAYSREELEYRRRVFICERGYSPEEYEEYKRGGAVSGRARRAFRRADRIKPVKLTPSSLLTRERTGVQSELTNPERGKLITMIIRLIPTTVCSFFTASVILTAKDNLTATAVIEGLLKLSALPVIGFKGYQQGYFYVKGAKCAFVEAKTRLLESFIEDGMQNSAA